MPIGLGGALGSKISSSTTVFPWAISLAFGPVQRANGSNRPLLEQLFFDERCLLQEAALVTQPTEQVEQPVAVLGRVLPRVGESLAERRQSLPLLAGDLGGERRERGAVLRGPRLREPLAPLHHRHQELRARLRLLP